MTLAVPFFILLLGVECFYGWLRNHQTYRLNDTINSLQMGTLSRLKGVLQLSVSGLVLSWFVALFGVTPMSSEPLWVWIVAFVAYDCCYYWKHRFGHEWRIMWASHAAHHQSEEYNLSTALRQTGTDYIGFIFYLPLYLAGIPVEVVITVGSLNLIYQFWVHTEHVRTLGPLEWIMITPSNHRVHHARNPDYIDKNYGGVFIIWDRLFGTFAAEREDQPCIYGITQGLKSWNPIWANFHVWYETLMISIRTRNFRDKLLVWFRGPGWYPEDVKPNKPVEWRYPKFDPVLEKPIGIYVFIQYWIMTAGALALTANHRDLPREFVLLGFAWFCFAFYAQGCLLEGRAHGTRLEWIKIVSMLLIAPLSTLLPLSDNLVYGVSAVAFISALMLYGQQLVPRPVSETDQVSSARHLGL